jgi:hypothetical protein
LTSSTKITARSLVTNNTVLEGEVSKIETHNSVGIHTLDLLDYRYEVLLDPGIVPAAPIANMTALGVRRPNS